MTLNVSTGPAGVAGNLFPPVNVAFTRSFLEVARFFTHYMQGTNAAELFTHSGTKTALWRRYENLDPVTSPLAELTTQVYPTRPGSPATVNDVSKAVDKYGDYLILNEEADVFNFNGQTQELVDRLAEQAGRSANLIARNECEGGATVTRAGGVAALDTNIITAPSASDLDSIINFLARGATAQSGTAGGQIKPARTFFAMTGGSENIDTTPILSSYYGVCHPDISAGLKDLAGFTSVEKYSSQIQIMPQEIGMYKGAGSGVRFCETADASIDPDAGGAQATNNLRSTTGTAADIYKTCIYGRDAIGTVSLDKMLPDTIQEAQTFGADPAVELISMPKGSAGTADPFAEYGTLAWKLWQANQTLEPAWSYVLHSGATEL